MHPLAGDKPSHGSQALTDLRQQLARALGPGVGVVCRDVDGDPAELWPVEQLAIQKAVPKRQREFAAGRAAAREAMAQIGYPPAAVPCAPDRSPIWPDGLAGSIAHTRSACIAIVAQRTQVHAIGVDVEEDVEMDPTLWPTICTPVELAALASLPQSERGKRVTRLFCAKEAFYKWQYPQTQRMLDFCDVQVSFNPNQTEFSVLPALSGNSSLPRSGRRGKLLTSDGIVTAWLIGPAPSQMQDG
jgi:4'-phosphopantetheinyl transferase EntD